jgi:hypothetical protein
MSVIPLTIFFSLLLAGLFIALFVHEQRRRRFTSAEHDSLLPLAEETAREAGGTRARRGLNLRGAQVPPQAIDSADSDPIYF